MRKQRRRLRVGDGDMPSLFLFSFCCIAWRYGMALRMMVGGVVCKSDDSTERDLVNEIENWIAYHI